jgi:hypothetical protein
MPQPINSTHRPGIPVPSIQVLELRSQLHSNLLQQAVLHGRQIWEHPTVDWATVTQAVTAVTARRERRV